MTKELTERKDTGNLYLQMFSLCLGGEDLRGGMRQPDTIMMYVLLQDVSHPDVVHNHDVVSLMELWNLGDQFASYCLCFN